jgi:Flp pilus assembly protein TadG
MIRRLANWLRDEDAAVAPILALFLVPLLGTLALAGEVSYWWTRQRALQNAADAAAVAAATNNSQTLITAITPELPSYENEARAVVGKYGFSSGGNYDVEVAANVTCPDGAVNCYRVTIAEKVPLYLTQVVGYRGDTTLADGRMGSIIRAVAIAKPHGKSRTYCMMSLGTTGNSLTINGGPNVDLAGCDMISASNMKCNGLNSDTGVSYGDAVGTSNCGDNPRPSQPAPTDPFDSLNDNPPIPANSCTSYPQTPTGASLLTTTSSLSSPFCGSVKLTQDITVTADTTLTIVNGTLDLNGHWLKTSGGAGLTIIFTGTSTNSGSTTYHHYPTSSVNNAGGLEIQAPTSSTAPFKGVALMQDKRLTGSKNDLDMDYSGNGPALKVNGLIYFPNGDFDIAGAINKAENNTTNLSCIGVIAKNILVSGTGSIFHNTTDESTKDCNNFVDLPTIPGTNARQALVE